MDLLAPCFSAHHTWTLHRQERYRIVSETPVLTLHIHVQGLMLKHLLGAVVPGTTHCLRLLHQTALAEKEKESTVGWESQTHP